MVAGLSGKQLLVILVIAIAGAWLYETMIAGQVQAIMGKNGGTA